MQARLPGSPRTRPPDRREAGAVAVAVVVWFGIALAVVLALVATARVPEQTLAEPPMKVAQPVEFGVLDRGANIADLERGRSYYVQLCLACHGRSGRGDGEWAYRMTPRPADLTGERTRQRSDEHLLVAIRDGVEGTAMRGWDDRLSGAQLRQVLAFVRHLGRIERARAAPR